MNRIDDLISRQAAIDMVDGWFKKIGLNGDICLDGLRTLPSAQPEHLVKESGDLVKDLVNDCISRQAAIDALRTHERKASKKWFDNQLDIEWNNAIDICCYDIEDLPSAQPETHDKRTEKHACDCISRQAAIDTVMECYDNDELFEVYEWKLNELPAIQQKKGRWIPVTNGRGGHECDQCHEYAPSYQSGKEHLSDFCPNCGADMRGEQDG